MLRSMVSLSIQLSFICLFHESTENEQCTHSLNCSKKKRKINMWFLLKRLEGFTILLYSSFSDHTSTPYTYLKTLKRVNFKNKIK
ncbi:hypothetical protein STCU_11266 [Strigomonas culicis]|uniref:Uncharacterized protein n=1 Tax=Strigomonas culicis TaxID=28005 RepID=S9V0U9_9TRYP|nr:hypothetical protein STCU_11266 [Strigomonas culicis]|eukprot:EPY16440.1 hypothetical protein STCU_11266 [Strigomonas culicis]